MRNRLRKVGVQYEQKRRDANMNLENRKNKLKKAFKEELSILYV